MPNVKDLLRKIESGDISYEEKLAALSQVEASLQEMKAKKEERVKFRHSLITLVPSFLSAALKEIRESAVLMERLVVMA